MEPLFRAGAPLEVFSRLLKGMRERGGGDFLQGADPAEKCGGDTGNRARWIYSRFLVPVWILEMLC